MQVEFVGLPGSGKSTVAFAVEKQLKTEGYKVEGLRNAARRAMKTAQSSIGFLQRRGERISLYGCMLWAHKNPELFQQMFRLSNSDFVALVWGMETLAQQGVLQEHGDPDQIVLTDEGFLQRLAWNFIERDETSEIDDISKLLPRDFLTVYLTVDPLVSFDRIKSRRKGVPIGLKSKDAATTLSKFNGYGATLDRFILAREVLAAPVMRVDAGQDVDLVTVDVLEQLRPHLPPRPIGKKGAVKQ